MRTTTRTFWQLSTLAILLMLGSHRPAPAATAGSLDEWIAALEGGWTGEENLTPMGKMPFAVLFEWQEDGSLRSHSALNRETYIDLHFERDGEGSWILHEKAAMEGSGAQSYSLVPTDGPGELVRWIYAQDPDYLTIDMSVDRQALFMDVRVRGEEHAQFKLGRLPTEEWPELKRELTAMAEQAPGEGTSILDAVSDEEIPPPIREARRLLASQPQDAQSHLGLAQAIGEAIQADGAANGPRFAFEMLQALQTAVRLDPGLVEAYEWLAGYYLSAPPIAGGSIDKAEEVARRLAEVDPEAGRALLARVAAQRDGGG